MIYKPEKFTLTDLHTHILPALDDGAQNVETAISMLRIQKENGIDRVALTPHFYPMHEELETFLDRRQRAYDSLLTCWDDETMPQIRLGAEVHYTPALIQMDMHRLTIGDSNYLLLELPHMGVVACVIQVVEKMLMQGITPILAHVERCFVFRDNPELLFELIQMGALAQIDAGSLIDRKRDAFAVKCLNKGLAHIVASDIHNLSNRAISLADIATEHNRKILTGAEEFARAVWDGMLPPDFGIIPMNKGFFRYY